MGILKLGGIASGMDTEGLIKSLMTLERKPLVQLQKRSDELTAEANAWRDLNSRLLTFQKKLDDLKSLTASDFQSKKATASDSGYVSLSADSTAVNGSYTVEVVSLAKATVYKSGKMGTGTEDPNTDLNLSGTIKVSGGSKDGETFTVSATDSLNDIAKTINDNKDRLGFTATVVKVDDKDYRLVITGSTGDVNDFQLVDDTGSTVAAQLKLTVADGAEKTSTARDAVMRINNIDVESITNTFEGAIAGVTITAVKVGSTTVTVAEDTSKVVGAVKGVVDTYNSLIEFMDSLASYDDKTKKAGPLFNDDRLRTIRQTIRTKLLDPVEGVAAEFNSLTMVGVTSEKFVAGQKASPKLSFDQEKFVAALKKDPSALQKLLSVDSAVDNEDGIGVRTRSWLENYTKTGGILLGQVSTREAEIKRLKDRITWFEEEILPVREQRLRDQFTALEKAMSSFSNQGQWLSAQLKSLTASSQA